MILLINNFQYNDFKSDQQKVIESFIEGENTLAIMPTGYGKSICFQIPALDVGRTLVISPLIALMSDQVNSLKEKHIGATNDLQSQHNVRDFYQHSDRDPSGTPTKCDHIL